MSYIDVSNNTSGPGTKPRRGKRLARFIAALLMVAGFLLIVDAIVTMVWQEPISALYADLKQKEMKGSFDRLVGTKPSAPERRRLEALPTEQARMTYMAQVFQRKLKNGQPIARIKIDRIGANFMVVQGTGTSDLEKGPGHYRHTPLPGEPGTVGIAGHRVTYLAPFRHIDDLQRGNRIVLQMPYGTFIYRVEGTKIVKPNAIWITDAVGYDRLVLSACHPPYNKTHRIVVFARLAQEIPAKADLVHAG